MRLALLAAAAMLVGCTSPQQSQQAIAQGQLYCALAPAIGPPVVALADASGVPVTVTGKSAEWVARACAVLNAIPVMPPADPASVPKVAADVPAAAMR